MTPDALHRLILALGMKPRQGNTMEDVHARYAQLEPKGEDALVELWQMLEPEPIEREWPDQEYSPEPSLKKRALTLGEDVLAEMGSTFPTQMGFEQGSTLLHLVMHGKLGLMSMLFALERKDPELRSPDYSAIIEAFMAHIEVQVEDLVSKADGQSLAKCLGVPGPDGEFDEWVKGLLQPFAMMRSVYLEAPATSMSPLQWWVAHERFIPALPE